jgi:hypothetical protein
MESVVAKPVHAGASADEKRAANSASIIAVAPHTL